MRMSLNVLLLFLMFTNCGSEESLRNDVWQKQCTKGQLTEQTTVHDAPRPGSKILFSLPSGTQVDVLEYNDEGVRIRAAQGVGWVRKTTIKCIAQDGSTNPPAGGGGGGPGGGPVKPPPVDVPAAGGKCGQSYPATWPVPSNRSVGQGFRVPSNYMTCGYHTGIDVSSREGADILAAGAGTVVHVGPMWLSGAGVGRGPYAVIVDHGGGLYSTYGHNSQTIVRRGDCVREGQKVGLIGNLGYSGGPHLHFEVLTGTRFSGDWSQPFANACQAYRDPMSYL